METPKLTKHYKEALINATGEDIDFTEVEEIEPKSIGYFIVPFNKTIEAIMNLKEGAVFGRLSTAMAKKNYDIFFGKSKKVKHIITFGDKIGCEQVCWFVTKDFLKKKYLDSANIYMVKGTVKKVGRPKTKSE